MINFSVKNAEKINLSEDVFEITDDGYATAKDVEVTDDEVKEDAISAMEGCPTSAIEEVKENNKED